MGRGAGRDAALDAQLDEVRVQLADVRGATKDLRQATRDAREAAAELRELIATARGGFDALAAERMAEAAEREIEKMSALTREHTDIATARIDKRFDEYTALLMTGSKRWERPEGQLDLRPANLVIGEGHPLFGEFDFAPCPTGQCPHPRHRHSLTAGDGPGMSAVHACAACPGGDGVTG